MTSALAKATKTEYSNGTPWMTLNALDVDSATTLHEQGIVATIVSANAIYIAGIAWPLICLLVETTLGLAVALIAFASWSMVYAASWLDGDSVSFLVGFTASGLLIASYWLRETMRRIPT